MQPVIKVENLTKKYAGTAALNGLSFEVNPGEIVGFLGPNGAGKSTTMKILTGFIPSTSGRVEVAGLDVFEDSLEVRRRIGYMPENNPLYVDMRVFEYLQFRAKLKGIARNRRAARLSEVIELCGLEDVRRRIIGQLSKGYRQRVGLADALLAEPDLLILDEPTIGLDPVQIRQVRELIKDFGKKHTILLSTHILPEVEMTCNRVIIIHKGKILVSDRPENLTKNMQASSEIHLEIRGPEKEVNASLLEVTGVASVRTDGIQDGLVKLLIEPKAGEDPREDIYQALVKGGWILREMSSSKRTLEDIFVHITREEDEAEEDRLDQQRSVLR